MKGRGLLVALALLAACTSGKSTSPPTTTSTTTTAPHYTPVFAKTECNDEVPKDPRVECGTLTVPEDRSKPEGRKVVLPVAIVHTKDPNPAPDPVVYFSGGPGAPGLTDAESFLRKGQTGNRDLIVFDQRGTGRADPSLDCPEVHEANAAAIGAANSFEAETRLVNDALLACRDRVRATGVDLSQYNTATIADDAADLRTAMGIKEWNLFGVSYGTTVALATMRQHPEGIRSVVIDSVLPMDVGIGAPEVAAALERIERVFFDGCAQDAACHAAYPDLERDFRDVIAKLDASPYRSTIDDPTLHRRIPITITGADAVQGFFSALYLTDLIPQLPNIIEQVKAGTGNAIIEQLAIEALRIGDDVAEAQAAAVDCHDRGAFVHPGDLERIVREHPEDTTLLTSLSLSCSDFGVPPAPAGFNDPVRSDLPTLVLGDEYDPVTPPGQSKHAGETLSHSTFVEFPGLGHGAVFAVPECPEIIFRSFLANPTAPVDTRCVLSMRPPKWALPGG